MEYYGLTEVGASGINADSYYISQDEKVFAVADGASGAFDKVEAGIICMNAIKELDYHSLGLNSQQYIFRCINAANNRLIEKSQLDRHLSFGTMTMAVVDEGRLSIGAVGDTPAFLIQGNKIRKIIKPKKRYAKLIELGILTEEEIDKAISSIPDEMWSMFDNFLPMVIPQIAVEEYLISQNDILIICTDGVSDWIDEDEFVDVLRSSSSIEQSCRKLFSIVNERCSANKLDDKTIIVVQV
ncbi:SpoIIE family protein phosphatase [Tissierella sp. MB52-C2]|uniref:PP2C family protein-serine/threonine phosphatase n=1 Tax=Tissierella sp. MB52-C2 TaxID=3070999 RepID=UPI00280B736A|nr:protein phosphatase 2C domain-containing protein [Tissierella sp. MB52-C2]WMM25473.1 SpoIIE family protein phosphatase [Tissierella sp. MB52-C2]